MNIFINRQWGIFVILLIQSSGMLNKIYTFQALKAIFFQFHWKKSLFFPTHLQMSQQCLLVRSRALGQAMETLSWGLSSTARHCPAYGAHPDSEDSSTLCRPQEQVTFRELLQTKLLHLSTTSNVAMAGPGIDKSHRNFLSGLCLLVFT